MPVSALETILPEIAHRYRRVRSGLTVGFDGETAAQTLRDFRGGVWMASEADRELPFDDAQFEVVVVASASVSREMVREANRILVSGGCMFFTVDEKRGGEAPGYTAPEIYRLVREGFDILAVHRPKWWYFGLKGHTLTVCARKKAWRERARGVFGDGAYLFTPFRTKNER